MGSRRLTAWSLARPFRSTLLSTLFFCFSKGSPRLLPASSHCLRALVVPTFCRAVVTAGIACTPGEYSARFGRKETEGTFSGKHGSGHAEFVVDEVALGQVFSQYFGFPCQSSVNQLLHNHPHLSSGADTIGPKRPRYQVDSVSPE
jgi:hypothetical protein